MLRKDKEGQMKNNEHKTAMSRTKLSAPMHWLIQARKITKANYILDYGCGKADDVMNLMSRGYEIEGFDPFWQPIEPAADVLYDRVVCHYVLNVIESDDVVNDVISKVIARLKPNGIAYFSVRRDAGLDGHTKRGTYQRSIKLNKDIFDVAHAKSGMYSIYEYVNTKENCLKPYHGFLKV